MTETNHRLLSKNMYNDIADLYLEIFPLNQAFLKFLNGHLVSLGDMHSNCVYLVQNLMLENIHLQSALFPFGTVFLTIAFLVLV